MEEHMVLRLVLFMAVVSISLMPAEAQGSVNFGPQIGFYKARDAAETRAMGGLAIRLRVSEGFGIESSINFRKEQYFDGYVEVNSWPVMVTGLFYVVPVVYGAIGAGWYNSSIDYHIPAGYLGNPGTYTIETHQEFGWHFGGGVELPVSSSVHLIGDIKYVFLDYDFTHFPGSNDVNSNFYVMTVGLLFTL
jgi:opacity protein-like surface antigen